MQIWDKLSLLNRYLTLKVPYIQQAPDDLEILLLEKSRVLMKKQIPLINYNKNTVYREYITLEEQK